MRLFVDTSAWLALNDRNDQYHKRAVVKSTKIKKEKIEIITSEYIIDESITLIRYRMSHKASVIFGDSLFNSNIAEIVDVTKSDLERAWDMFRKFKDKELSFTDCTSFALMKTLKLQKAFTFDSHFKQVGIKIF